MWRNAMALLGAVSMSIAMPIQAETQLITQAEAALEYNDNLRMRTNTEQEDWVRTGTLSLAWNTVGPRGSVTLKPMLRARRHHNETVMDNDDYFVDLSAERSFEYSALAMQGYYYRDASIASEFDGSGFLEVGVDRERWGVKPLWSIDLSPQVRAQATLAYDDVSYDSGNQVDYDVVASSLGLARVLDEDERLGLTIYGSRLEAPQIANRADQLGAQIDYGRPLGEKIRLSATLGARQSRFTRRFQANHQDNGLLLGLTLDMEREYAAWRLSLSRTVDPSGTGTLMQNDSLSLTMRRAWSESLSSSFAFVLSDREDLQGLDRGGERLYGQLRADLNWQLAREWTLSARYRFIRDRARLTDCEAESNAFILSVSYRRERVH